MKTPTTVIIIFLSFTLTAIGQTLPDSLGFTNKTEAKNLMVNGVKEGKWLEYIAHIASDDSIISPDDTNKYVFDYDTAYNYTFTLTVYKNGKISGIQREYRRNGTLSEETKYHEGKVCGPDKGYYENGKIKIETTFLNGSINRRIVYFANGNIESSEYGNGVMDTAKWYYESGKLEYETYYLWGRNQVVRCYFESGKLEHECKEVYDSNDIKNITTIYYESGGVMTKTVNRHDEKHSYYDLVSHKNYDENGKELKLSHFSRHTQTNEILNLLKGTWVFIDDTGLQITITKKELFISKDSDIHATRSLGDMFWGPGHGRYTLKYVDSSMGKEWGGQLHIDGWAGYCLISNFGFFTQIYSINSNYMVIYDDLILKRKDELYH